MQIHDKIYVAGHRGLAGSAIVRALTRNGFENLLVRTHAELDLTNQAAVTEFFRAERPDYVFLAAARVGGIRANAAYPAEFIRDNLLIQTNVVDAARVCGVKKLLFLGSSCIYPKFAPQPMTEDRLLTGELEPTNQWYAVAKIAGIKLCQAYRRQYGMSAICLMPTNLYGPEDNFNLENAHVIPALMHRFHKAKMAGAPEVVVWGGGEVRREFMHADDLGEAAVCCMRVYDEEDIINVGVGRDITIRELAQAMREVVGYDGDLVFDAERPEGTPRKLLEVSRITKLGWRPQTSLAEGLAGTYAWFVENQERFRG